MNMNKSLVLATLVAAFALTACGKKEEAAAPVAEAASAVVAPVAEAASAAVAPMAEAASAVVDAASAAK
jgi:predicted small lipoprotein YifL